MNESLTQREVLYFGDLLSQEVVAVDKFSVFANECNDPELKSICREMANVHMRHFDRLLQQLNVSGMSTGANIGASTRFTTTYGQGTYGPSYTAQAVTGNVTAGGTTGWTTTYTEGAGYTGGYGNYAGYGDIPGSYYGTRRS